MTTSHSKPQAPSPKPKKNTTAQSLGRLGKNKSKTMTPAALQARRQSGFQRQLPKATIATAQRAAQDETTFTAPPGPLDASAADAHYNDAE